MTTPRRDFLGWLGASGAFAALPVVTAPSHHPRPVSDKWDMTWCDRITGKARAVFDSPEVSGGAALFRAQFWRENYQEVYDTPPSELSTVVVFRHAGIPLVMNDTFWARFDIGKAEQVRNEAGKKWAKGNPIAGSPPKSPSDKATGLPAFIASGGIVLACNLAFGGMVDYFHRVDKLSEADARKRALEQLIPGVILQPSGGFALHRAQQAGCSFMLAS